MNKIEPINNFNKNILNLDCALPNFFFGAQKKRERFVHAFWIIIQFVRRNSNQTHLFGCCFIALCFCFFGIVDTYNVGANRLKFLD